MPKYAHPDRRPAVVTGASSGIGAETAKALATAGHPVALGARRVEVCEELAAEIRNGGGEAVAHPLDMTDDASVEDFCAKVAADLGDIEVVISNAGAVAPGKLAEISSERLASELDLNLVGAHRLIRTFVPGMIERQRGDIVFVSSDVVVRPRPFMAGYSAGKWGLEGMVGALQMELRAPAYAPLSYGPAPPGPRWAWTGIPRKPPLC